MVLKCKHDQLHNSITLDMFKFESDSKLYTSFEFCEGKKSQIFGKHIDLQSQAIFVDYKEIKKVCIF